MNRKECGMMSPAQQFFKFNNALPVTRLFDNFFWARLSMQIVFKIRNGWISPDAA